MPPDHPRHGYALPGGPTPYRDDQWAALHAASIREADEGRWRAERARERALNGSAA